jgi:HrpA-like RNA helicase
MSATLQDELFRQYFGCPIFRVEGRTFPVTIKYLKDTHMFVRSQQRNDAHLTFKKGKFNSKKRNDETESVDIMTRFETPASCNTTIASSPGTGDPAPQTTLNRTISRRKPNNDKFGGNGAQTNNVVKPKFDPEAIAELVIRIIQSSSSGTIRSMNS